MDYFKFAADNARRQYQYRVNFGNGQVHYAGSKTDCLRFIGSYGDGYSFVEWRDPDTGDWFRTGNN